MRPERAYVGGAEKAVLALKAARPLCFLALALGLMGAVPATAHLDARDRIRLLSQQIDQRPEEAQLYLGRAMALVDRGRFREALDDVASARARGGDVVSVALVEATTLLAAGRPRAAEEAVTAGLSSAAGDVRLLHLRAASRRAQGRWDDAAADLEAVVTAVARPGPELVLELSNALREAGHPAEARRWVEMALLGLGPSTALWREVGSIEREIGPSPQVDPRPQSRVAWELLPVMRRRDPALLAREAGRGRPSSARRREKVEAELDVQQAVRLTPVTRGPYLQLGTPTSVVVRWRTSTSEIGRVRYGASPGDLTSMADESGATTEHELHLGGLAPATAYFYSIGTPGQVHAGDDAEHRFVTPPPAGTRRSTRIWVLGDSGTADANAAAVRDAFVGFAGAREPDLWLMLGDNAYNSGIDGEYQAAVFDTYPRQLRRQVLWPTLGNHDATSADSATQSGPYFDIFTLPTSAEAGGMPSGTEAYYSFDWANLHFVVLDSQESDRSTAGAMLTWLEDDLMLTVSAGSAEWIVAFWHHPPYTKGSHDSDSLSDSFGRMTEMRENALPILEDWGVDLVLTGHSHSYERSVLLDGHYDISDTFGPAFVLDAGDGSPAGDGPYVKSTPAPAPHEGAVYVVAGSSGKIGGGSLDHPAMHVALDMHGSLVLDVEGLVLSGTFVEKDGAIGDRFTLVKGPSPFLFVDGFESGDPARWSSTVP